MNTLIAIQLMNQLGQEREPFFFFTDFLGSKAFVSTIKDLDDRVAYQFGSTTVENVIEPFEFEKKPIAFDQFVPPFQYVIDQINFGNSYLVNLTFETPIETNLSLQQVFDISRAKYKVLFEDQFVLFSPETFVLIKENKIYSYPMKGTIDAKIPNAESVILNDVKETAEHVTIVDLIRNDF